MADMLIELEMARSQVFRALAFLNANARERDKAVSSMKVQIGRSAKFVGGQAIQLHGGIGVTEDVNRIGMAPVRRQELVEGLEGCVGNGGEFSTSSKKRVGRQNSRSAGIREDCQPRSPRARLFSQHLSHVE